MKPEEFADLIKSLEEARDGPGPEDIQEKWNMDQWYDGWERGLDLAIKLIQDRVKPS